PSGCGKSTLLRVVAGLRRPTRGSVEVDGRAVTGPIPSVGMVFQAPVLLKWRTVRDNVLLPAELAGLERARYRERAEHLLRLVGPPRPRRRPPPPRAAPQFGPLPLEIHETRARAAGG